MADENDGDMGALAAASDDDDDDLSHHIRRSLGHRGRVGGDGSG